METVLDVWEGSLDIDEALLLSEGIRGLIIRLNDMNGGHHLDENFHSQWNQAINFLRAPYFVYNPWATGSQNYTWMRANLPLSGVTKLLIDVEVKKPDYSPEIYADELQIFINLCKQVYPLTTIYTGGWFLSILAHWPTNVDYWWARYPYTLCPQGDRQMWSWQKWRTTSNNYGYLPDPLKQCPSYVGLWQCSGDKLILPGCANRPIDLNLFNGNLDSLEQWWGAEMPGTTLEEKINILWREAGLHGWNLGL